MNREPLPPLPKVESGRYRHYKTLEVYEVIGVAYHSETLEPLVVYRALYGDRPIFARPYAMFVESIDDNGQQVPRFAKVD